MTTETYSLTNPSKPTITKDPNAVLDYSWDWSEWLAPLTDTILSFQIILGTGSTLAVDSSLRVGGVVTAFLSGGTLGATESATCRIVTAGGRTDDRTIYLKIAQR